MWIPQRAINSYPDHICDGKEGGVYQPGDFVIHFPSLSNNDFLEYFKSWYIQTVGLEGIKIP